MRWRAPIQLQIFAAVTLLSGSLVLGFGYVVTARVQDRAHLLAHEAALEDARLIALIAARVVESKPRPIHVVVNNLRASGALLRFSAEETGTRIQFYNTSAALVFDSALALAAPTTGDAATTPADVVAGLAGSESELAPAIVDSSHVAAVAPIRQQRTIIGAVRVIKPSIGMQTILAQLGPEVLALALAFVLASLGAALLVGRSLSLPVRRLTAAARDIATGDRARQLPPPVGREVFQLTTALTDMRRELEDKHRIVRFTQDLSHELKNPIASILSLTEALEAGGAQDPTTRHRLLARIGEAAGRLEALVADLLSLAQLEATGVRRVTEIELAELVRETAVELEASRDVKIEVTVDPGLSVTTDRVWLRRGLSNLLNNAAAESKAVRFRAELKDELVLIRVSNPGEVPASLRDRLFERFVSRREGGTGLGLSIVNGVAQAHGGTAWLELPGPPEVVICMTLQRR